MIGYYGKMVFEVNEDKVCTFNGLELSHKSRLASHDIIGKKSKNEFVGLSTSTLSFNINLLASLGVSPKEEIAKWKKYLNEGIEDVLIIGDEPIADKWIVTSISETWNTVFNHGELYSASLKISMEECND